MTRLGGDVRAFGAAIRKEWRQIRRYPLLFVGLLYWPTLLPAWYVLMGRAYSGGASEAQAAFAARSGVSDVTGFIFVGMSMWLWLSFLLWGPGTALRQEQVRGTLESVYLTPASRLVVLFGPPLAHLSYTLVSFAIGAAGMRLLFGLELPWDGLARAAVVVAVAVPSMHALASLFSAAVLRFGEVNAAVHFVRGVLVLAAGVTFPVVMLPEWAQLGSRAFPPSYVVADVRAVLLARAGLRDVAGDLAILGLITVPLVAAAVAWYRWNERHARRSGMIAQY